MQEKDIADQYGERVSAIVEFWGYRGEGYMDRLSKAIVWLTNFADDEIEDAYRILSKLNVISASFIQSSITSIAQRIRTNIGDTPFVISSLDCGASSSGSQFLYLLSRELSISHDRVVYGHIEGIVEEHKVVVLVDDIVGSGGEAIETWGKIKNRASAVYYYPILCFTAGKDSISQEGCFVDFFPQNILGIEEIAFGEQSRYFKDMEERNRLKKLATKYGKELYPTYPLGYKDTQAMIAWETTGQAPNNTLPIVWAGPRNEAKKPWKPIFERILSRDRINKKREALVLSCPKE